MSKFCQFCDNLLIRSFPNENQVFKCMKCQITYDADENDSLIHERIKEANVTIYEKILNKAVNDPVTIKAKINCPKDKCNGDKAKQVRLGDDMRLYNICIKCEFIWLN